MSGTVDVDDLWLKYHGRIVPQSFNVGFIALSYVVSLIGAACTLELLNRRTSHKGTFNHLLLVTSAVSMGGIAIWCMHFIGNRAIHLGDGEAELQIAYSGGFTALSFFVPIVVLLAAFVAIGTNNTVSWWRVTIGGVMAGAAICGMHYVGNNSIENYSCIYTTSNVVGSAIIAVAASIVSLALFFVFRATWTNTWWKRLACSVVLAGAVSGMHWCAATGTKYQLVDIGISNNELSRNTTVIVVICLSILACCIMAAVAIYTARVMRRYASKAQQVVLASAVFDKDGRILVNPDGLIPSEKITDSFIEKNASDTFSIAHPLFHWMFRASRNWPSVSTLLGGMENHLAHLPQASKGRDSHAAIKLIDEQGEMVANYDILLRELFCVAAMGLADKMKETLPSVGILWDGILPTGGSNVRPVKDDTPSKGDGSDEDLQLAEKGLQQRNHVFSRGSLMFLVRRVQNERDVAKLEAAGYRFAEIKQVSGIIGPSMQIKCWDLESEIRSMAAYADEESHLEPGVHLGFFGIRARVGSFGFDVLARKGARNLLPSVQLPLNHLEPAHLEILQQLDGTTISSFPKKMDALNRLSAQQMVFLTQLFDGVESLRSSVSDAVFEEATLSCKVVTLPFQGVEDGETSDGGSGQRQGQRARSTVMIAFRLVIPIHVKIGSGRCEFVPLNFFKMNQLVERGELKQLAFAQEMHREFAPLARTGSAGQMTTTEVQGKRKSTFPSFRGRRGTSRAIDGDGNPIPTILKRSRSPSDSHDTGSTLKLWPGRRSSDHNSVDAPAAYGAQDGAQPQHSSTFGGIMVSEEIRVEVQGAGELRKPRPAQGRSHSRLPRFLAPFNRGSGGRSSQNKATATTSEDNNNNGRRELDGADPIEMTTMAEARGNVHTGSEPLVSNVGTGSPQDGMTFVDELFSLCIDSR